MSFLFFLLRILLRKEWAASLAFVLLLTPIGLAGDYPVVDTAFGVLAYGSLLLFLRRFGLVTLGFAYVSFFLAADFSMTSHLSAWYAGGTLVALLTIVAMAVYGFHTSLAGRPLLGESALDA